MQECEPIGEPVIENGEVVLRVLFKETQHVFRCSFRDPSQIKVASVLRDHVASGSALGRAAAVDCTRQYIAEHADQVERLFVELRDHPAG